MPPYSSKKGRRDEEYGADTIYVMHTMMIMMYG